MGPSTLNFHSTFLLTNHAARHLAEVWSTTYLPPHPKRRLVSATNLISPIEHLILLDLLGAPSPSVRSYFPDTGWLFDGMIAAESRLYQAGVIDEYDEQGLQKPLRSFFIPRTGSDINYGWIGDDHQPFLNKGVSVLHIIAQPFPRVWHQLGVCLLFVACIVSLFIGDTG
jgi:glutaminyl-peptide cyclotransferase